MWFMELSSGRGRLPRPPSLLNAYFSTREHEGQPSWTSHLLGLTGLRALLQTQLPRDLARLSQSLHDKGLSADGWRCLRISLEFLSTGDSPIEPLKLMRLFERIQVERPPDSSWATLTSLVQHAEAIGDSDRRHLLRIFTSWSEFCEQAPSPEQREVFHRGWTQCPSHSGALAALASFCAITAENFPTYRHSHQAGIDFLKVTAGAVGTLNGLELGSAFSRILEVQKRHPASQCLNGIIASNLDRNELGSPLFRAVLDVLVQADRHQWIEEILAPLEQLERNYAPHAWGITGVLENLAEFLRVRTVSSVDESRWVTETFSRLFFMGCAGRENVDLVCVELLGRLSSLPNREDLTSCIAGFNAASARGSHQPSKTFPLYSEIKQMLRFVSTPEALALALEYLEQLAPDPKGLEIFFELVDHSGQPWYHTEDSRVETRWIRHCGEFALTLREASFTPHEALLILPAGLRREADSASYAKIKLMLPQLLATKRESAEFRDALRELRTTELMNQLVHSKAGGATDHIATQFRDVSQHDNVPYPLAQTEKYRAEPQKMQREVYQIFSNLFDLSSGFGSLTFDARTPPGSAPALVRFGERVASGMYYMNATDNRSFPGRGFVIEAIDPYLALGGDVETLKKTVIPWAAQELDELPGAIFILQRGLIAISCPRSDRFQVEGRHYSYVVYNNEFYPGAERCINVPTDVLLRKIQRSLVPSADYTGPRVSTETPDLSHIGLSYQDLSQAAIQAGGHVLNIGWGSNIAGLANAFPPNSVPHFSWEQNSYGIRDVWGHVHKSYLLGDYSLTASPEIESLLVLYRDLHSEVYHLNRSYQRLFNLFQLSLSVWHKSTALREAFRWHHAGREAGLSKSDFPVLCLANVFQYSVKPPKTIRLDTFSLTLEVVSEDGSFRQIPLPLTGDGLGKTEVEIWESYVKPLLNLGNDLRFFHRDSVQ